VSYSFQVTAKDSVLTVAEPIGAVPDGRYTVNGHEDGGFRTIGVTQFDEDNTQVAQATGYARRS
jgi:hypothetical protein